MNSSFKNFQILLDFISPFLCCALTICITTSLFFSSFFRKPFSFQICYEGVTFHDLNIFNLPFITFCIHIHVLIHFFYNLFFIWEKIICLRDERAWWVLIDVFSTNTKFIIITYLALRFSVSFVSSRIIES